MKRFVVDLAVGFCQLCDAVIAPSETIRNRLSEDGVTTEIQEIPTGVDLGLWAAGNGAALRARLGIPPQAFVVGHVGRLAPEKGLSFLAAEQQQPPPWSKRSKDMVKATEREFYATSLPATQQTFSADDIDALEMQLDNALEDKSTSSEY